MLQAPVAETTPEVALADLGVRPELITAEERRCLDIDGYVVLEDVIPEDQRRDIGERLDAMLAIQRSDEISDDEIRRRSARRLKLYEQVLENLEARRKAPREDMTPERIEERMAKYVETRETLQGAVASDDVPAMRMILEDAITDEFVEDDLFETDPAFDLTIESPRVLSAVAHVLGPMFHLLNVVSRCPRPGHGQQALHRTEFSPRRIATTIWLIDDMTLENGPTRLVPGSHQRSDGLPDEMEGEHIRAHPDEIKLTAPAGSVVVFDDRCWHGGSLHKGGGPRRVVISSFTQRSLHPSIAIKHPEETLARLSPGQVWLLHRNFAREAPSD
jgi:ectoine hydroxylase-related dioxygenase (phytanoyl-CoA dioxygenase family)